MFKACLALAALGALEAPVQKVTVYSDRARVTRAASLPVSGEVTLELPLLLDTVDPSSIRVEATGAEVRRVDIAHLDDDQLEPDEARKLLGELDKLGDQLALARAELAAHRAQLQALASLDPAVPEGEPLRPRPRLNSSGWTAAVSFVREQSAKLQVRERELSVRIQQLEDQRSALLEKARILGGTRRRTGYRVTAHLFGNGAARIELSYLALRARWHPVYDLQLLPDLGKVEIRFAGLVSQETGEDWGDAQLTLSTAVPATSATMPKVASWKIGERDRFIPTPRRPQELLKLPPPAPPLEAKESEEELLRQRLLGAAGLAVKAEPSGTAQPAKPRPDYERRREEKLAERRSARPQAAAPPPPAPSYAPAAPSAQYGMDLEVAEPEEETILGGEMTESTPARERGVARGGKDRPAPAMEMSLSPPPAYRRPSYAADLPASLAGGYDLSFASLRRETVRSGKGARRVALFSETWPVSVERKLFPALASEAYLVAEIKSPSSQVLPGGSASLFVGDDPAGNAQLQLVAPGEAFTLPLGLDRALRPIRNVELKQAEQGFIGKDEINLYVVTTELANPYRVPVAVRILDQWPLTDDEHVEVKLLETKPYAIQDKLKGSLEWRLNIPPQGKSSVSFTYSIRRPKGWRMHQQ
ncbi:MAG: mucoidy inhibitor MuiA family protein [Myxococcales bacterium]|nr:mucoidy inhibitor MuiA family protein [Myxococcales bacterium]